MLSLAEQMEVLLHLREGDGRLSRTDARYSLLGGGVQTLQGSSPGAAIGEARGCSGLGRRPGGEGVRARLGGSGAYAPRVHRYRSTEGGTEDLRPPTCVAG